MQRVFRLLLVWMLLNERAVAVKWVPLQNTKITAQRCVATVFFTLSGRVLESDKCLNQQKMSDTSIRPTADKRCHEQKSSLKNLATGFQAALGADVAEWLGGGQMVLVERDT